MKKVSIGPCPVCGKSIWKYWYLFRANKDGVSIFFKRRPYKMNEHGRHFWILETTGSRMMVAICKECFKNITDDIVQKIHADIIYTKLESLKKIKDKGKRYRLFDHIRTTEVWKWAETELGVVQELNKAKNG